ncbi:MAG: aldo/keto reductase [Candidatus Aminicenantia bacterium]
MDNEFSYTSLGNSGLKVFRLGLSATYRPGKKTIYKAIDEGINFFFYFHIDTQMVKVLRDVLQKKRDNYIVSTGAYNLVFGHLNLRKSLEKRLRQLKVDYIDIFYFLGVLKEKELTDHILMELQRFKEEGKIRFYGISTHNRKLAGKLASDGALDVIMMRYNAAHRGAEKEIFPYLEAHKPFIVGYTATRWRFMMRRPKGWPKDERVPTAGMAYRFVLSNPHVNVCLTAPMNMKQLEENFAAVRKGSLNEEEMEFMRKFGDKVHETAGKGLAGLIPFSKS